MANSTVLSIGGVTVSTAGGMTGNLLQQIINSFGVGDSNVDVVSPTGTAIPPAPTGSALPAVLVIPSTDTGVISIPSGYAYVVYSGTGSLTGGDAATSIIGSNIHYTGPAGEVLGTGGSESVTDSTGGGTFSFATGSLALNLGGSNDTVGVGNGTSGNVTLTGNNDVIVLGSTSVTTAATGAHASAASSTPGTNTVIITGTNETTSISGASNLVFLTGTDNVTQSGGSSTIVTGPTGIVTMNALGGTQLIYSNAAGADVINAGPSTEFVGFASAPATTFTSSAGGADTVFAGSGINYLGTSAASTFFLGGNEAATVLAGASATIFGGTGGGSYTAGADGMFFWNTTGGTTDSILGGSASGTITAIGGSGENLVVSQLGAASGGTYTAWGQADTINAMDARGGNTFYIVDQTLTIGGSTVNFSGDTTLVGSTAGNDLFAMFDFGTTSAHTITIENWQSTDKLFLDNYSPADSAAASAALAAAAGTDATFSLSDGTTVKFIGTSPTSHI
jgi:hypothetical protein